MTEEYKFIWEKCGSPEVEPICGFCENSVAEPAEITLAHVLIAMSKKYNYNDYSVSICHSVFQGWGFEVVDEKQMKFTLVSFAPIDLTKNLREQSLETQQAIAKLLGRKE